MTMFGIVQYPTKFTLSAVYSVVCIWCAVCMEHPDIWLNLPNLTVYSTHYCTVWNTQSYNAMWLTWLLFSSMMDEPELISAAIFNTSFLTIWSDCQMSFLNQKKNKNANQPYSFPRCNLEATCRIKQATKVRSCDNSVAYACCFYDNCKNWNTA